MGCRPTVVSWLDVDKSDYVGFGVSCFSQLLVNALFLVQGLFTCRGKVPSVNAGPTWMGDRLRTGM